MTYHTLSLLTAALILLTGCKMDPDYTLPKGESGETILVGDITEDFVLSAGRYHLEGTVRVRTGPESISQTLIYLAGISTCYLIIAN